jgi:hypothetical protein
MKKSGLRITPFPAGWWFGTWLDYFPIQLGIIIIPTDEVHHFSEG